MTKQRQRLLAKSQKVTKPIIPRVIPSLAGAVTCLSSRKQTTSGRDRPSPPPVRSATIPGASAQQTRSLHTGCPTQVSAPLTRTEGSRAPQLGSAPTLQQVVETHEAAWLVPCTVLAPNQERSEAWCWWRVTESHARPDGTGSRAIRPK